MRGTYLPRVEGAANVGFAAQGGDLRGLLAACGEEEGEGVMVGPLSFNQSCFFFKWFGSLMFFGQEWFMRR
ncbi:hypothetical protein Hanom_Chr06g00485921 [Helianthus anomalus]